MNKIPKPLKLAARVRKFAACLSLIAGLSPAVNSHAAELVKHTFGTTPATYVPTTVAANVTAGNLTLGTGLSGGYWLSTANGVPPSSLYVQSSVTTEAVSASSTDHIKLTVRANAGYVLNLSSLSFDYSRFQWTTGEVGTWTVRSSLDGFTTNLGAVSASGGTAQTATPWVNTGSLSLSGPAFQNIPNSTMVEFRIYLSDNSTQAGSQLRTDNITINGTVVVPGGIIAVPANDFLNSMGINVHIDQGYPASPYVEPLKYTGIRNVRDGNRNLSNFITLHNNTIVPGSLPGVKVIVRSWPGTVLINDGMALHNAGALRAFEGRNEPNNEPFVYGGQTGGGSGTWIPVANWQRDYYAQIKAHATLKDYPVFSTSEVGAETDNVGLQFLTIPTPLPAGVTMPAGTQYADYANCHNYVQPPGGGTINNNQAWNAASPTQQGPWDGLYSNFGNTWGHHYVGYTDAQRLTLPRVCTETGWGTSGFAPITEAQQGKILLNVFLSQFKRGWAYTCIYQLRDGEGGDTNSQGIYRANWTPKPAADYIHNLTTILTDLTSSTPGSLNYSIPSQPATTHDLLLQKSNGKFYLVVWSELATGTSAVTVNLGGTYPTVKVYDPIIGVTPTQTLSNVDAVSLTLSDHPVIIEL